jgi:hypothetical protein
MHKAELKPRFRVGSSYFFGEGHDIDEVEFEEHPKLYKNVMQFRKRDKTRCLFKWRKMSPDEFVEYTLNSKLPMEIGKFLVPEVAEYLGFTMEHLKRLAPVVDRLDGKHKYERIIYEAYMENGAMFLTPEQRDLAYAVYKSF